MKAARRKTRRSEDSRRLSSNENVGNMKKAFSKNQNVDPRAPLIRKLVDPETSKYFTEIANALDGDNLELEERTVICANALEEASGKELELATDYILSHTIESLLEGCDFEHLSNFLRGSANVFNLLAVDRSGSHVVESGLKSLVPHLQDIETCNVIEDTLETICKAVLMNPIEMMCNRYGSHVLRSLLCLLGGLPMDSLEVHGVKKSSPLPESLTPDAKLRGNRNMDHRFPRLLKLLVFGMLNVGMKDLKILQGDPYCSLVQQTALKLLEGHDEDLLKMIPILFGCGNECLEGYFGSLSVSHVVKLLKQTAFSHLVEVILEVAPQALFEEMLIKIFKGSLLQLSLDQCGNFVVQALICHARNVKQFESIWKELSTKFWDILEAGKSGVIASLFVACQRLEIYQDECAQFLTEAVSSNGEDTRSIVPKILCLDMYFSSNDRLNWSWPSNAKMHVMGSLMLQAVFKFKSEAIQNYVSSMLSMETNQIIDIGKDSRGARVIEAFLGGNVSMKLKRRLIMKLRGHFGELAMHLSGSFTVEKCFLISNLSLREIIASEILDERELAKTKQGPYILRFMDIDCFASRREQWRSKQESKQSTYKEFYVAFGSTEAQPAKNESKTKKSCRNDLKRMRDEIEHDLAPPKHSNGASTHNQTEKGSMPEITSNMAAECKQRKPFLSVDMKKPTKDQTSTKHSKKRRKT